MSKQLNAKLRAGIKNKILSLDTDLLMKEMPLNSINSFVHSFHKRSKTILLNFCFTCRDLGEECRFCKGFIKSNGELYVAKTCTTCKHHFCPCTKLVATGQSITETFNSGLDDSSDEILTYDELLCPNCYLLER